MGAFQALDVDSISAQSTYSRNDRVDKGAASRLQFARAWVQIPLPTYSRDTPSVTLTVLIILLVRLVFARANLGRTYVLLAGLVFATWPYSVVDRTCAF